MDLELQVDTGSVKRVVMLTQSRRIRSTLAGKGMNLLSKDASQ